MMDEPASTLEDALDAFAQDLLTKAKASDNVSEMLKTFEAVGRYVEQKAKAKPSVAPPAKVERKGQKFAALRNEFTGNGQADKRRARGRPAAEDDLEAAGSA